MNKTCFIIMPISDMDSYPVGHFKRVYEYIIKPAVTKAGFQAIRADDILNTNFIAIDIIKRIISSDIALCDLSARNPNVFYELGIRQAFNLPVTLIRDSITERVFDIQGFRDIEYDESLRVDNVELSIELISETLINTYNNRNTEINSLISLLGIHPAQITSSVEISKETEIILGALDSFGSKLNKIESLFHHKNYHIPNLFIDDSNGNWQDLSTSEALELKPGELIEHFKFGKGKILDKSGHPQNPIIEVLFQYGDRKKIMVNYAKLKKLVLQN